jgi:hypothetical protein
MLLLAGLHAKHGVAQRGIWVPTQHLPWDQGKPRYTLIAFAYLYVQDSLKGDTSAVTTVSATIMGINTES